MLSVACSVVAGGLQMVRRMPLGSEYTTTQRGRMCICCGTMGKGAFTRYVRNGHGSPVGSAMRKFRK